MTESDRVAPPPAPAAPAWRSALPVAITSAFGTAAAMWTLGYALRFPGFEAPGPVLGVALLGVLLAGCWLSGRWAARGSGALAGAATGLIAAAINLLVLGSLAGDLLDEGGEGTRPNLALMLLGWLGFSALAGFGMGLLGGRSGRGPRASAPMWASRFAAVTALAAFFLLVMGGVVTSAAAGLAVPDWPNTFGSNMFLFPLSRMTGDIYLEHAHRLYGSLVGLMTMTLTAFVLVIERRAWVKWFSVVLFLWVCAQGVLGGLRVTGNLTTSQTDVNPNDFLGMVHGVTGQMFVAMLAVLAASLSKRWRAAETGGVRGGAAPRIALAALVALLLQIALGAATRHFGMNTHALISHVTWSAVAAVLILAAGFKGLQVYGAHPPVARLSKATLHTLGLQMALGLVALIALFVTEDTEWNSGSLLGLRTAHQSVGALLLVVVSLLAAWGYRWAWIAGGPDTPDGKH